MAASLSKMLAPEKIFGASVFVMTAAFFLFFGLILIGSGGTEDLSVFHRWLTNALNHTISDGYKISDGDYPPLLAFTFFPLAFLKDYIGYWTVIHLSILFNLLLSTFIFYKITKNVAVTIAFYFVFFYPAIILKYLDINYTPFLLVSLFFLSRKLYFWFGIFFTVATLIKWQPLILAPFLTIYLILSSPKESSRYFLSIAFWKAAAGAFLVLVMSGFYFGFSSILSALTRAVGEPYLSGNALNMHWIITHYLHTALPGQFGGLSDGAITVITPGSSMITLWKIPFVIFYLFTIQAFLREETSFENLLKFSMAVFFTYFMLNTGVHENHLYIAVLLGLWLTTLHQRYLLITITLLAAYNFNILIFQGFGRWLVTTQRVFGEMDITLPLSYAMLLFWSIYWATQILPSLLPRKNFVTG